MDIPKPIFKKRLDSSEKIYNFFATLSGLAVFSWEFLKQVFIPPYDVEEVKKHMLELGVRTFPIVSITGFIIGLVMALQSQPVFEQVGASDYLPGIVAISIVRELAPVITALIFAGRVSSGIGAELGSMRVTEQIDAMEVSAVNPFKYLVVTRIIATTMILPLLTVYVIVLALAGSYIAVIISQSMSFEYYRTVVIDALHFSDFIPGILKTFVFGYIVGLVGSYKGFTAEGGTEGVGKASTNSVVIASLLILLFDAVLVKLTLLIWPS